MYYVYREKHNDETGARARRQRRGLFRFGHFLSTTNAVPLSIAFRPFSSARFFFSFFFPFFFIHSSDRRWNALAY